MPRLNGVYAATPLNISDIPQDALNIANKNRSNPLRWNGQFSPQLVQVLLSHYATPESVLFDPFLGSGTVLLEAGLNGLSASGTEINPAAVTLAELYRFINVPLECRRLYLNQLSKLLQDNFLEALPLFQSTAQSINQSNPLCAEIKPKLVELSQREAFHAQEIKDAAQAELLAALIVLLDFSKGNLSTDKLFKTWAKLARLVTNFPFSAKPLPNRKAG